MNSSTRVTSASAPPATCTFTRHGSAGRQHLQGFLQGFLECPTAHTSIRPLNAFCIPYVSFMHLLPTQRLPTYPARTSYLNPPHPFHCIASPCMPAYPHPQNKRKAKRRTMHHAFSHPNALLSPIPPLLHLQACPRTLPAAPLRRLRGSYFGARGRRATAALAPPPLPLPCPPPVSTPWHGPAGLTTMMIRTVRRTALPVCMHAWQWKAMYNTASAVNDTEWKRRQRRSDMVPCCKASSSPSSKPLHLDIHHCQHTGVSTPGASPCSSRLLHTKPCNCVQMHLPHAPAPPAAAAARLRRRRPAPHA